VVVPPDLPGLLETLVAEAGGAVALVSGRAIATLDRLFAPVRLAAAGVHGAEMRFPDGHNETAAAESMDVLRPQLAALAERHPGLLVEDKGVAMAVHFRAVPALGPTVESALTDILVGHKDVHLQPGKMVFEVRPAGVDKGRAVSTFMRAPPFAGRRPFAIGDDLTDESMLAFALAAGGSAARVGDAGGDAFGGAAFADTAAVRRWLTELVRPQQR
jgi:trehalose 6-phosphate phosphatase